MENNKKKTTMIILGVFALVVVTTAASYAFFTYNRTGNTTTTITSGDIEFTYNEGTSVTLQNAFPVADSVGAIDTKNMYTFDVKLASSSSKVKANYNVTLLTNNEGTNVFKNENIKYNLVKNNTYVVGSSTTGELISSIEGFNESSTTGSGMVLTDQEINAGTTDSYKLRIWIDEATNYSNTIDTNGTMTGSMNSYTYSVKVKVDANTNNTTTAIENLSVSKSGKITASISDEHGLKAYAVTQSSTAPDATSSEWIAIDDSSALSDTIKKMATAPTSKTIEFSASEVGTYYIHVKNSLDMVSKKTITIKSIEKLTAADYIMELAVTNKDELMIINQDDTNQTSETIEYRYYGAIPNNYISFNNELWRIIGVFEVDDGTGKIENRLKIVRNDSLGNYSWDSSATSVNGGWGVNEWSQSDLKTLLNEMYYNATSGNCYSGQNNATRACDFRLLGLTSSSKLMIGNAKWYTAAVNEKKDYKTITATEAYKNERGAITGKSCSFDTYCNDTIERTTSWIGKVGLIYLSDYGYAAGNTCLSTYFSQYNSSCKSNDWLYISSTNWMFSALSDSSYAFYSVFSSSNGDVVSNYTSSYYGVRPVVYLTSDITIVSGTGTNSDPFILEK